MSTYGDSEGNCTFSECDRFRGCAKRDDNGVPLIVNCNYKEKKIGDVHVTKEHHCPLRGKKE